uniref:Uncharacterized protein n=1 Tax=Arundo donax TaxID=35708 RepID=A0A0A9HXN8_ARUDO
MEAAKVAISMRYLCLFLSVFPLQSFVSGDLEVVSLLTFSVPKTHFCRHSISCCRHSTS